MSLNRKIIIVGAGVSGASAAQEFIKNGVDAKDILILEMNPYIGGKLRTYTSPTDPNLKTEYGAGVLVQNYPIIDTMYQNRIALESLVPSDYAPLDIYQDIMRQPMAGKFTYAADFVWQQMKFARYVWEHNKAKNKLQETLPKNFEIPFTQFSEKNGLQKVSNFLQFLVPGFGYGNLYDQGNNAARMFNYMGYTTMPGICTGQLFAVHDGYQQIVEKMVEGVDVETSAHILGIERENDIVNVVYEKDGKVNTVEADTLVLANSPYYWKDLNMKLTPEEQKCVDDLTYYRYPVAICRIKGLPAQQIFISDAMREYGFGHAAFLFTRDNRENPEDGRLYTVYINLPAGKNDFSLDPGSKDRETILNDLRKLPGVTDVEIKDATVWKDYNPSVPYIDSINLQKAENKHANNTLHVGAYRHDSFETVAATSGSAQNHVDQWMKVKKSKLAKAKTEIARTMKFFALPVHDPYTGNGKDVVRKHGHIKDRFKRLSETANVEASSILLKR